MVPPGWAARHRPIVHGFFADRVLVRRRDGYEVVDDLGTRVERWVDLTPHPVCAQVQVVVSAALDTRDASGEQVQVSDYLCRIDVEWLPDDGDRVIVVSSPDPANLGTYVVRRRESQNHVVDRTLHLERVSADATP